MQRGLAFIILPLKKIEPLALIRIATKQKGKKKERICLAARHKT